MLFNHTEGGKSSARLNAATGKVVGPSMSLEVKAGDTVRMEVHAKYLDKYKGSKTLPGVASLIAASLVAAPANEALNIVNELQSVLASGQIATFSDSDEIPKAYLQYLYFDKDYKFKKSGFRQVSRQAEGSFETLTLEHVAEEDGFMMMYVANETNEDLNVFFDDLTVVHSEGPVIRKDDYYPFGLSYNTSTLGGALTNKYLYNGKEFDGELGLNWNDYGFRFYDPAIGRFTGIDPIACDYSHVTPYNYAENYPTGAIDLWGLQKLVTTVYDVQRTLQNGELDFHVNQLGPNSISEPKGAEWSGYKHNNVFFHEGKQVNNLGEVEGYNEWRDNKLANSARTFGETLETTGDITKYLGIGVTPFAPEIGLPMIKAGSMVSATGIGLQVSADLKQEKYQNAVTKIGLEVVTGGASKLLQNVVNKLDLEKVATQVLNSQVEAATEVAKISVNQKLDKMEKEKQ